MVAPLGTIDAGEAGIRVSGNVNFAALQVVNAANVQVQGKSTGLPVVASVNVGALSNASAVASQAAAAAQDAMTRERAAQPQNLPSIFTVRMLGGDVSPAADGGAGRQRRQQGCSPACPIATTRRAPCRSSVSAARSTPAVGAPQRRRAPPPAAGGRAGALRPPAPWSRRKRREGRQEGRREGRRAGLRIRAGSAGTAAVKRRGAAA